ncbi:MAG TPA: hypothetical protein V6D02_10170 [Candidatus Obscuribacterales bacterium]
MNAKFFGAVAIAAALTVGTVGCGASTTTPDSGASEEVDPCAGAADPCAADPCAADPCAADPCAADPCAAN